jgi:uncharacterized protein (DUF58 family)
MTVQAVAAVLLILGGSLLEVPVAVVLGTILLFLEVIHWVWVRYGLDGVTYERRLATDRTSWGHDIPLSVEVWNRKRLPLAWLRADDEASSHVIVRERPLVVDDAGALAMRNAWTLAPFERVVRQLHVGAERRGVFTLGPVRLSVGDLFARRAAAAEGNAVHRFIVRPRTVATRGFERPDRWGGEERARFGLTEDPARFVGVRPYAIGDPRRRMHHRTSARLGRPITKRFEPSRDREVLLALDVQTEHGPAWDIAFDSEAVESLIVIAASLARSLAAERATFGIVAAGYTGAESRFARLAVSAAPGQLERVLDLLARLSSHASAPFERLLDLVHRTARPGTTIVVVTARDSRPFFRHLRSLQRAGCDVVVLACGLDAAADVDRARAAGFVARKAALDGPWQSAQDLAVSR